MKTAAATETSGAPVRQLANLRPWPKGTSGNPSGQSGAYGEAVRLARQAAPAAIRRLVELMGSPDERVAAVACNAILDRALGKPKAADGEGQATPEDLADREASRRMTAEEIAEARALLARVRAR